jgi:hypothetical protein
MFFGNCVSKRDKNDVTVERQDMRTNVCEKCQKVYMWRKEKLAWRRKNVKRKRIDGRNKLQVSVVETSSSGWIQQEWGISWRQLSVYIIEFCGDTRRCCVGDLPVRRQPWNASYHFSLCHEKEVPDKTGSIRSDTDVTNFHSSHASILQDIKFTPVLQ